MKVSRIGVSGAPAVLHCQSQGERLGMRPHGCCRGVMWVPHRVGGYPGKTRFAERMWVQESGGGAVLTMVEGFDQGVALERVKGQVCEPVGIIEGPCWRFCL